jgi:hypothetical protein
LNAKVASNSKKYDNPAQNSQNQVVSIEIAKSLTNIVVENLI